jgi:hypothetical protein
MTFERRNSGATLHWPCVVKVEGSAKLLAQARSMERRPDVYCSVLATGRNAEQYFCAMPLLQNYKEAVTPAAAQVAATKLERLWGGGALRFVDPQRAAYQVYVGELDVPLWLRVACRVMYDRTATVKGHSADEVHGDATLQNIVHAGENAWWIDPNTRHVPLERELDLGKLLQSLYGYDADADATLVEGFTKGDGSLFDKYHETEELQIYYLLTHLARLWRYQPDRQAWVREVVTELENEYAIATRL